MKLSETYPSFNGKTEGMKELKFGDGESEVSELNLNELESNMIGNLCPFKDYFAGPKGKQRRSGNGESNKVVYISDLLHEKLNVCNPE